MGHLLDYELFQPCWHCNRTDCNGNHPEVRSRSSECSEENQAKREAEWAENPTHHWPWWSANPLPLFRDFEDGPLEDQELYNF